MKESALSPSSILVLGVCLGLGCAACERGGASAERPAARRDAFPVAVPERRDLVITHEYVADVRAARHAEVRARFRGIIEAVAVDEGRTVKAGQRLFTINARAREQELAVAKAASAAAAAELAAAQLEVDNVQLLADSNVVSPAELARARSKVAMLRAKLDQARATAARAAVELDRAVVRAPFDGVVHRIPHKAGSAVDENAPLTTVSDAREVLAYFAITEREYLALQQRGATGGPGPVRLQLADGTTFPHEGTIDAVGSEIDAATGTIAYRARFPNPDGLVKHGSSAKVVLEERLRSALVVPQRSTFEIQGEVYLYAVDADDTVRARKIVVRERVDDVFVIEGIDAGERFVREGVQKVKDGLRIDVRAPTTAVPPTATTRG